MPTDLVMHGNSRAREYWMKKDLRLFILKKTFKVIMCMFTLVCRKNTFSKRLNRYEYKWLKLSIKY